MSDDMERGIYTAGFQSDAGHEVFVAVDAQGRKVGSVTVVEGANRNRLIRRMWRLLDAVDGHGAGAYGPKHLTVLN